MIAKGYMPLLGLCMVGWINLAQNQSPYLLKKMVNFWKVQLVNYIDLHWFPPYLFHVIYGTSRVFFFFLKHLSKKIIKYFFLHYDMDLWKNVHN